MVWEETNAMSRKCKVRDAEDSMHVTMQRETWQGWQCS